MKKILITDDHYVVRTGLAFLLESKLELPCSIDFADSFTEAQEKISSKVYDLLILDIDMPDSTFKSMIKQLKGIQNDLKIIIFSFYDEKIAIQYINEGANGYMSKSSSESNILNTVSTVINHGYYYSQEIMKKVLNSSKEKNSVDHLSKREYDVFKLLAEGNGNIEIANILDIQMSTISTYKKKIFEKLKVKTIVDLVRINDELH